MSSSTAAVLTPNAMAILEKRYLDGGTVNQMWDRVSGGNEVYRELMSSLRCCPSSPVLFNLGKKNGCTSSPCFVFNVSDCMAYQSNGEFDWQSIMGTKVKAACVAKAGGGVGYYLGFLRPKGSPIRTVHRKACGPIAVLKDYQSTANLITQGGKRELAQMGTLPCSSEDILEFIHLKDDDPQGMGAFNISVSWTDEWLGQVDFNSGPNDALYTNKQTELWWEQCKSAWKTGCPGMYYHDTVNKYNFNKHLGLIYSGNPCNEAFTRGDGVCSLASLALPRYFISSNRGVDWKLLEQDSWNSIMFMDDILDRNEFPHPDITKGAHLTKRLGLGVMGWADLLAMMHIHYDTEEALSLGRRIMKLINEVAVAASVELGKLKGPYHGYDSTKTQDQLRRNETVTSIAPCGTIGIITGCWGGIEPHFSLRCERTTSEGMKLQDGVQDWCWEQFDGFVPKTADQISPEWHVRMQAAWQEHVEMGISKTVNVPNNATVEDVSDAYRLMHQLGTKGGTCFRDGCRSEQVLVKKKTSSVYQTGLSSDIISPSNPVASWVSSSPTVSEAVNREILSTIASTDDMTPLKERKKRRKCLPDELPSIRLKIRINDFKCYLHVGLDENSQPMEIFLRGPKLGSTISGLMDHWAMSFSMLLQHGVPLEQVCNMHKGARFEPAGLTSNKDIKVCSSPIDFVSQWLLKRFVVREKLLNATIPAETVLAAANAKSEALTTPTKRPVYTGDLCPECQGPMISEGSCQRCIDSSCAYVKCGG